MRVLDFSRSDIIINPMDVNDVISENKVEIIDVRYSSLDGRLRSISFPVERLDYFVEKGIGVDGSSIGIMEEDSSDMLVKPCLERYFMDPFAPIPTLILMGELFLAGEEGEFSGDSRNIVKRTVNLFSEDNIADEILILPELEFYIFDECNFHDDILYSFIDIVTEEGYYGQNGYHVDYPYDKFKDYRSKLIRLFQNTGMNVKYSHHEVGKFGQYEFELSENQPLITSENILISKYFIHKTANSMDKLVTFMPKPIYGEPGNGMHFHILLKYRGDSIFYDKNSENHLSDKLRAFSEGILKHGRALSAFTNPTTNSFKRLTSGFEAPRELTYSIGSRCSAIRVPDYMEGQDIDIEYRPPDATCNPYLAISAILLAGYDGIKSGVSGENKKGGKLPENLKEAAEALGKDHEFLIRDEIFPEWLVKEWIDEKKKEFWEVENRPSPVEFKHYFSI